MLILHALALTLLTADMSGPGWEQAAKEDGVTVFSRQKPGSSVKEMKALGLIDAPPEAVWKALRDYEHYKETMPYTEVSQVISREGGDKVTYFYSVVNAPMVDRRDYVIKLIDESEWKDGKGFLQVSWTAVERKEHPPTEGIVRVKINDGIWRLEPREDGKKTFATYFVFTDPGGSVPNWIANKANSVAVPNVFNAIRKTVSTRK